MSRSYKHTPGYTCGYGRKGKGWCKRASNKQVRNDPTVVDGMMYKKNGYTWDICDWKFLHFNSQQVLASLVWFNDHYQEWNDDKANEWKMWRK